MSKKFKIAIGIIVIAVIFLGIASWQTGKKIEKEFPEHLVQLNKVIQKNINSITSSENDITVSIKEEDYQRGIFSSQLKLSLTLTSDFQYNASKNNTIPLVAKIEHGPFPLSELISLHWLPKIAIIKTEIAKNSVTSPLFELTKNTSPITIKTTLSTNSIHAVFTTSDIESYDKVLKKIKAEAYFSLKDNQWIPQKQSINAGLIKLTDLYDNGIIINGLSLKNEQKKGKYCDCNLIGDGKIFIDNIKLIANNTLAPIPDTVITLNNIELENHISDSADDVYKNINIASEMLIKSIYFNKNNVGKLSSNVTINNIDMNFFRELIATDILTDLFNENGNAFLYSLLRNNLNADFNLNWKSKKGVSKYKLDLTLNDADKTKFRKIKIQEILNKLNSDLTISIPMVKYLYQSILNVDEAKADKDIMNYISFLKMISLNNDMLVFSEKEIKSNLKYNDGVFKVNDKVVPADSIF